MTPPREPAAGRRGTDRAPGDAAHRNRASGRIALLDVLRGVAIIAVVFGHVVTGLNAAGLLSDAEWMRSLTNAAYSVRMPMFAFMAGLFVAGSSERRGRGPYLRSRLVLLGYLYVLWTCIQGAAEIATAGMRNGETGVLDVVQLWSPIAHLWFLPWLLIATTVAVAARPWRPGPWRWVVLAASLVLMVLAWGVDGEYVWDRGLGLYAFFLVGAAVGTRRFLALIARIPRLGAAIAGLVMLASWAAIAWGVPITVATTPDPGRTPATIALGILAGVLGIAAAVLLCAAVVPPSRRGRTVLGEVGRASMAIYLAHILVAAGIRIVLVRLGIDDPIVLLVVAVVLGVLVPMLLERVPVLGQLLFRSPASWSWRRGARRRAVDATPHPAPPARATDHRSEPSS